ncbi:YdcH family protein [Cognatilysobacter terrigena]|uniref:YdcH family protein n=1 Tax=Cognatilysobacter terrigena TaxID=2488749 RepID=UPI00105D313E|nr:YdcH family protein [Lysobacter terrigena]
MNDGRNPADIARQLAELRQQHRDLDLAIEGLKHASVRDELAVTRLKKRKLQLKDAIARLESSLIPDEPA